MGVGVCKVFVGGNCVGAVCRVQGSSSTRDSTFSSSLPADLRDIDCVTVGTSPSANIPPVLAAVTCCTHTHIHTNALITNALIVAFQLTKPCSPHALMDGWQWCLKQAAQQPSSCVRE